MDQMSLAIPEPVYEEIEPVVLEYRMHHKFVPPAVKPRRGKGRCQVCKRKFGWVEHHGFPQSMNRESGSDFHEWDDAKRMWQKAWGDMFHASSLPRGLERVTVIARYTLPNRSRRDRDNLMYPLCKFLGDTLVRGRYFEYDYDDVFDVDGNVMEDYVVVGKPKKGEPVVVADPLGGWIPDDRWDRFEVTEVTAVYEKDVAKLELMIFPDARPLPPWPPAA